MSEFVKKHLKEAVSFTLGFALAFIVFSFYKGQKKEVEFEKTDKIVQEEVQGEKEAMKETEENLDSAVKESDSVLGEQPETIARNSDFIKISEQNAGDLVVVDYAKYPEDFWLVVHDEINGRIMHALGARMKKAGEYKNINVPLLAPVKSGAKYWLVIYKDNGDGKFDFKNDFPAKSNSAIIMTNFKVK